MNLSIPEATLWPTGPRFLLWELLSHFETNYWPLKSQKRLIKAKKLHFFSWHLFWDTGIKRKKWKCSYHSTQVLRHLWTSGIYFTSSKFYRITCAEIWVNDNHPDINIDRPWILEHLIIYQIRANAFTLKTTAPTLLPEKNQDAG